MPARPIPSQRPVSAKAVERDRIACLRCGQDRVDGVVATLRRSTGAAQQGARPDLGLPAPQRPAATRPPVGVDRHVPDLAAVAGDARQRPTIDDEATAHADRPPDEHDVVDAAGAPRRCSARAARSASLANATGHVPSERFGERTPSGSSRQPRLGAIDTIPSLRRTTPTTATPTPTIASGAGRRSRTETARTGELGGDVDHARPAARAGRPGRGPRPRRPARPSPPRASRRRSRERGPPRRSGPAGPPGDGRPGVPSRVAGPSVARRPATSSPMSPRIALRVSPVRPTSSERESVPLRMQFAHDRAQVRPPNGLAPLSELVPTDQHEVCVPLSQMAVRDSYNRAAMSIRIREGAGPCRAHCAGGSCPPRTSRPGR